MDYRILGWLEAADERGNVLGLPGAKPRAVLCLLLLRANRVVSSDVLIEELWRGAPPRNAGNALQAAVSRVRKAIGADRLWAQAPGSPGCCQPETLRPRSPTGSRRPSARTGRPPRRRGPAARRIRASAEHGRERSLLATTAACLAKVLVAQARPLDAVPFLEVAETEAASDDLDVQIVRRSVRARILAEAGEASVAVTIAGEAVALADGSDWLNHRADARVDLAATLGLLGREDEAGRTFADAAALYARKGNLVAARRARASRRSLIGDATSRQTRRSRC